MNMLKLAGVLLVVGFVLYLIAMFVAPRLYQEPDIGKHVAIIAANQTRWNVSQLFFALGLIIPAVIRIGLLLKG
jgi:hypothetical protein